MTLESKRFLVSGATGGIGIAVVPYLLAAGAHVHATYRDEARLQGLVDCCGDGRGGLVASRCDLTDAEEVARLASDVAAGGPLAGVVSLVGGWRGGSRLWDAPVDELDALVTLNLRSTWMTARALLPQMIDAGGGRFITVGSRIAHKGRKNNATAASVKSAVATVTLALAEELVGTGVAAYCIEPGTVATAANIEMFPSANHARWVAPERIAAVIAWLLDDDALVASGAIIPVHGDS